MSAVPIGREDAVEAAGCPLGAILIPLSRGLFAIVDEADGPIVLAHRWHAHRSSDRFYAFRTEHKIGSGRKNAIRRSFYLHRMLLPNVANVEHVNGNTLDNRRENLRAKIKAPAVPKKGRPSTINRRVSPLRERFEALYEPEPNSGCWLWLGELNNRGYPRISVRISRDHWRAGYAHRVAWELYRGPIPEGLTIDHLCRNPTCVNPEHLEPVTLAENVRRAAAMTLGKCKRGHPLNQDTVYVSPQGRVQCRKCIKLREARRSRSASCCEGAVGNACDTTNTGGEDA